MGEWYEDWFASEEYLSVYRHRDKKDADELTKLILDKSHIKPGSRILDIACGAGRHSISFAQKGYDVTGIDLSPALLRIAEKNARNEGLNVNFLAADMRSFRLPGKFDLACSLFTSFGYFERDDDDLAVFRNAYEHLSGGSFFVIDYLNAPSLFKEINPITADRDGAKEIIQRRFIEDGRVYKEIIIKTNGSCRNYWESVRLYSFKEFNDLLADAGFTIKSVYGDYFGQNYMIDKSPRLIIFAVK